MASGLWLLREDFRPWADWLLAVAAYYRIPVEVTSTRRTPEEQRELYRAYLSGRNRYPVARPGTSQHEQGLAIDIKAESQALAWLGRVWSSVGRTWSPSDPIHFGA